MTFKVPKAYVILEFKDQLSKAEFIGGLLAGWGENGPFSVNWDDGGARKGGASRVSADEAPLLRVTIHGDE